MKMISFMVTLINEDDDDDDNDDDDDDDDNKRNDAIDDYANWYSINVTKITSTTDDDYDLITMMNNTTDKTCKRVKYGIRATFTFERDKLR